MPIISSVAASEMRGGQFIPFKSFDTFTRTELSASQEWLLTSPPLATTGPWRELIVSWNVDSIRQAGLAIEARAIIAERFTDWFCLGQWAAKDSPFPRTSVRGQRNADGRVDTDTLILNHAADGVQVRVRFRSTSGRAPKLKFLGLSLVNPEVVVEPLPAHRAAWGKVLPVVARSQMAYENGAVLCSPTTLSMLLAYWGERLQRPGLDVAVPEIVREVFDPAWGGTGNWVFNTAYAGSFRWLRAYTTRLTDVSELEQFIAAGIPVGVSLCYNRLRGKGPTPSGHLVVCVGFTKTGDVIVNDPGTSRNVQKTFPRANLEAAWAHSRNAVYLIYPTGMRLPEDRFGHWESSRSRRAISPRPEVIKPGGA